MRILSRNHHYHLGIIIFIAALAITLISRQMIVALPAGFVLFALVVLYNNSGG